MKRKFNTIKKSRKKSKDIDEKIEYLNKECQKTGLHEIANSTTGLYQGSSRTPNEKYQEFTGLSFNGYPFGISGDSNLGQESVGGAMIRADGVAMSPPHPITGERTVAYTKGSYGMKIAIPGQQLTPQSRMTGPVLWWFDPSYTFAGAQGRWMSMEYNSPEVHGNGVYPTYQAGWGYWGSNFMGFALLRNDENYQSVFNALNDSNGDQFNPDNITIPTTTVFFQNELGDPTHLPIDVRRFGLSPEGFDTLLDKSKREKVDKIARTGKYPNASDQKFLQDYLNNISDPDRQQSERMRIFKLNGVWFPLASAGSAGEPVSDIDINPGLGAQPGDELAFGGFGGGKPTPPTKKSDFKGIKRNAATTSATMSVNGMGMSPEAFKKKYGISPQDFLNLPENKTSDKKYLEEGVKLGHFDPEVLTVDIEKLRKGIMPEFPKDPPEMIGGYSAKSRLVRKDPELPPFIKVTRKDLARNHKLTDKEISEFMNDIKLINDYIKKNPAELLYVMTRYPKDDPRLAQLNFKMDQMKAASDEYIETHFPENQKLFDKLQDKIIRNVKQTDPKNFTGHKEAPKFTDDNSEMNEQRKRIVTKHFKKKVILKKLFHKA